MLEKADRCTMCGTAKWEWDPEQGGNRFAYEAVEDLCQGCLRKSAAQETADTQHGTSIILVPTNTASYRKRQQRMEKRWRAEKIKQSEKASLKKRPHDGTG